MSYCDFRKPCHDVKAFPQSCRNVSLNGKRIQDNIFYESMIMCAEIYNHFELSIFKYLILTRSLLYPRYATFD